MKSASYSTPIIPPSGLRQGYDRQAYPLMSFLKGLHPKSNSLAAIPPACAALAIAVLSFSAPSLGAKPADQSAAAPVALERYFEKPPADSRPWVYWFWNNGAVTREGITADLESMARVGIGGMILMDVLERHAPPKGDATFMSERWQELFAHAVSEAARLGLEITMTNGPGWCGSSGPWITPELSMQMLVFSETKVDGPNRFDGALPKPDTSRRLHKDYLDSHLKVADFYRDIAVLAFPLAKDGMVPREKVIDLTGKMDAAGKLTWDAPPGEWLVLRLGHTTTGSSTRPPVLGGNGLECDKLSARAMDVHFDAMMKKLIERVGPNAGKSLVGTHIDSWEVGYQDWTPEMRSEFQKRRGYDPLLFLPNIATGPPDPKAHRMHAKSGAPLWHVGGKDLADRFRWDFWQTASELLSENNSGRLAERARGHGLRTSIEGYDLPFGDEATYAGAVDEPMCEFWTRTQPNKPIRMLEKCRQMASVGHVMGRRVIGAEAFTADAQEQWKFHPAIIKSLGDHMFSLGINRFVIHRFAHQPWLDRAPGAVMGPWGLHYERTNTWWEMSSAWHEYLARCQFMLRQGLPVADLLYLRPQIPNQNHLQFDPPVPTGYQADDISARALIDRASVKNGRIVLPNGTSYRMLVLPKQNPMTPELVEKIRDLTAAGATILGTPPQSSPSLAGYPDCDRKVRDLAREIWGDGEAKSPSGRTFGKGRVFEGQPLPSVLAALKTSPDFQAGAPDFKFGQAQPHWCHRADGDTDLYFIANPLDNAATFTAQFRVAGKSPEFWHPDTGRITPATDYQSAGGITRVPITLDPAGSVFVVFRNGPVANHQNERARPPSHLPPSLEITGPWELRFPPELGAPEKVILPELACWTKHADPGVRHFSGTAIYQKSFDVPSALLESGRPLSLDLGEVHIMARVKLNGHDLGILWKPPYRVEAGKHLKPGANTLEIALVNLWPNRLIGDAALPEDQRVGWTAWQPFKPDSPLLPSGLLGPVRLLGSMPFPGCQ